MCDALIFDASEIGFGRTDRTSTELDQSLPSPRISPKRFINPVSRTQAMREETATIREELSLVDGPPHAGDFTYSRLYTERTVPKHFIIEETSDISTSDDGYGLNRDDRLLLLRLRKPLLEPMEMCRTEGGDWPHPVSLVSDVYTLLRNPLATFDLVLGTNRREFDIDIKISKLKANPLEAAAVRQPQRDIIGRLGNVLRPISPRRRCWLGDVSSSSCGSQIELRQ